MKPSLNRRPGAQPTPNTPGRSTAAERKLSPHYRFAALTVLLFISATGCGQPWYPPPAQLTEPPHRIKEILDMTGGRPPETWGSIVSGVADTGDPNIDWRWAAERTIFHFRLERPAPWSLIVSLTAARAVLDKTGPQRVTFQVNGRTVGAVTLDVSRRYDLSFPLGASEPVALEMDVSPCLPQQQGPSFCVLLHKIGFVQESR